MNTALSIASIPRQMVRAAIIILAIWTLAIAVSMIWNVNLLRAAMVEAATHDARNSFRKDVLYRRWATLHGGVYVPVTDLTPPNPYLTDIFERDIVTPSGRPLTLINPAYMTRQVHELGLKYGSRGHITSLNPLRPANRPDAWEAAALKAFEQGQTEVISQEMSADQPELRFMKPLITEAGCLKCHAVQGYKEGEIRGGVSISVALTPYFAVARARIWPIAGVHAGLWIFGVLGLLLGMHQMRERINRQLQVEMEIRSLSKFPSENPFPVLRLSQEGTVLYANEASNVLLKEWQCSVGECVPDFWRDIMNEVLANQTRKIMDVHLDGRVFSFVIAPVSELNYANLYGSDITERRQGEEKLKSLLKEKEVLIREVHHRVKNNFVIVSSLLGLQSRDIHDMEVKAMFIQSRDRINSIALIHQRLYESQDLTHINFSEYIRNLATDLFKAYKTDLDRISSVIEVDDIDLDVDKVLPCGLIVNELISNALKYGFPESRTDKGQIKVSFRKIDENEVELAVTDNGIGLPVDFDIEKSPSLGLQLVTMMAEDQLKGKLKVDGKGGAKFQIQFALHATEK